MVDDAVIARGGPCGPKCKSRYVLAILGSIGMGIVYGLKVNLHVTIVAMINGTALNETGHGVAADKCGFSNSTEDQPAPKDGPFDWNSNIQGLILSSYFWGYMVAELPGGRIAEMLSAKWVMFFAVSINVVCVILAPVLATAHYAALIVARVLQGIGGGVTFPAMHVLLAHWAPPGERSVMSNIVYAGTALGTVVFMLVSGVIADNVSWQAVFYIEGGLSAIWLIFWVFLIADSPDKQKLISEEEREFINSSLSADGGAHNKHSKPPPMPWKAALTSPAFLAILVAHTCGNWGWYMVLVELPLYMKTVLHFDMGKNAVLTAVPFLTMYIFSLILSNILDYLKRNKKINTTTARKVATLLACVCPMICFIALCFVECNRVLAVVLMTIAITFIGGMFSGYLSNHIDIAPNFAGTLMALTNTVATIPGITVPIVVGELTKHDPSLNSWRIIFGITIGLYIIQAVIYASFASGEVQKWNEGDKSEGETQPLKSTEARETSKNN